MAARDADMPLVSNALWVRGPKRAFDLFGGIVLLALLAPLLIIAALLVKFTSRGSVFFRQDRAGKDGRIFRVTKFRTMRGGRKPDPLEIVPLDHPEITPVGRLLRRLKFDELPQLFHVVTGEMSLVGPRPTLPDQAAAYDEFRRRRLLLRPGVTGLAQVYGNSLMPWDERILYDVAYVRRCSLGLDLHVLLRTIRVLVLGEKSTTRRFFDSRYAEWIEVPRSIRASLAVADCGC
jgi:lipopolysaccharide/colanic/teichoic acid biosynthesis glycosyltransferase